MLSCPLQNNGIINSHVQHTLDNLCSKAQAANTVFLFSIIQPSSLCPLPSGTMTSWDIITNQHELPVLCAVQITKKVFHNTPCFFPPGPFILYIGLPKVVCGIEQKNDPCPHESFRPSIFHGDTALWLPFVLTHSGGYNGIILSGEDNVWQLASPPHNVCSPICASQRGWVHRLKDIH